MHIDMMYKSRKHTKFQNAYFEIFSKAENEDTFSK